MHGKDVVVVGGPDGALTVDGDIRVGGCGFRCGMMCPVGVGEAEQPVFAVVIKIAVGIVLLLKFEFDVAELEDVHEPVEHCRSLRGDRAVQLSPHPRLIVGMTLLEPDLELANGLRVPES